METCDFDDPLFTDSFLREWHNTVPVMCPHYRTPFTNEDWKKSPTQIGVVEQVCDCCERETTIDIDSNKYQREMNLPSLAIRFF